MQSLDKATVIAIRAEIEAALQAVATKHGVNIKAGKGSYSTTNATLKIEISTISDGGTVITQTVSDFQAMGWKYGFKPEDLGRTFVGSNNKTYVLAGLDRKSYTYPMLATHGGKTFKMKIEDVKRFMGIKDNFTLGLAE